MNKTFTVTATITATYTAATAAEATEKMHKAIETGSILNPKITAVEHDVITTDMFTRVNSDINGNPRYVIHFLNFFNESENNKTYDIALKRAKKLGGRKFNNKQYGGGIVFQSYNIADDAKAITAMLAEIKAKG